MNREWRWALTRKGVWDQTGNVRESFGERLFVYKGEVASFGRPGGSFGRLTGVEKSDRGTDGKVGTVGRGWGAT